MFLSLVGLGCFGGAGLSYAQFNGRHLELLVICGVIFVVGAEIVGALVRLEPRE
jgi:hypothetical protein